VNGRFLLLGKLLAVVCQHPVAQIKRFNSQGQSQTGIFLSRSWAIGVLRCRYFINVTSATCFDLISLSSDIYFYVIAALYCFFL
jgi:hypothetical protein